MKAVIPPPLPLSYYQSDDVLALSRDLLGKVLVTRVDETLCAGRIVETEAYGGVDDKASHSFGARRTRRNASMYLEGGHAYVYLCYGIHHLFNVVTSREGIPHAILIRAAQPLHGFEPMLKRRKLEKMERRVAGGPGALAQAFGLTLSHDGIALQESIWIGDDGTRLPENHILTSPRVGVGYAEECARYPWRFRVKENPWTSPAR